MSEEAIRASLAGLLDDGGRALLSESDLAHVSVAPRWACVVLGRKGVSKELLARVYGHLAAAFPGTQFEVRGEREVYRGGAGFGEGRHVVAVLGGKGGVGKSTLAVNLALTLSAMGVRAGLLDADLNAPDLPHMLGVHPTRVPRGMGFRLATTKVLPPSQRQTPYERFGVEVMSIGFSVPEKLPPVISTRMLVSSLLRHLVFDIAWTADVLVIDAPPGTGEELNVLAGELPLSGALFVTTPQDLAQMDAERTLTLLTDNDVPVIGMVQNMASMTCPHCDEEIDMYGTSSRLSDAGVAVLGRIPFDLRLARTADQGLPLVLGDPTGPVAYEFAHITHAVRRWLKEREAANC